MTDTGIRDSLSMALAMARRDLRLAVRKPAESVQPMVYLLLIVSLFPLALGPSQEQLGLIAVGVCWVTALLAGQMTLEHLFRDDYQDGTLAWLITGQYPLGLLMLARILAHWLVTGIPIALLGGLAAAALYLPQQYWLLTMGSLALGTLMLSLLGSIGAALTVSQQRGGLLLAILMLPLYVPTLIFGAGSVAAAQNGLPAQPQILMLLAMLCLALPLCPWATAKALKVALT